MPIELQMPPETLRSVVDKFFVFVRALSRCLVQFDIFAGSEKDVKASPVRSLDQMKLCIEDLERTKNRQWMRAVGSIGIMIGFFTDPFKRIIESRTGFGWSMLFGSVLLFAIILQLDSIFTILKFREMKEACRPPELVWRANYWSDWLDRTYKLSLWIPLLAIATVSLLGFIHRFTDLKSFCPCVK